MKRQPHFRAYDPHQSLLLPPSLRDWLPEDHLAYFVMDVVDTLDLSALYAPYAGEQGGQPPYEPGMMLKLLFYGYCIGERSSRGIERQTYESVPFRVIAADQHPDHSTIAEFRKRHLKVIAALFLEILQLGREAGLVKLGHVAIDGTKLKANASKHKAMSYDRMEAKAKELEALVERLLAQARTHRERTPRRRTPRARPRPTAHPGFSRRLPRASDGGTPPGAHDAARLTTSSILRQSQDRTPMDPGGHGSQFDLGCGHAKRRKGRRGRVRIAQAVSKRYPDGHYGLLFVGNPQASRIHLRSSGRLTQHGCIRKNGLSGRASSGHGRATSGTVDQAQPVETGR